MDARGNEKMISSMDSAEKATCTMDDIIHRKEGTLWLKQNSYMNHDSIQLCWLYSCTFRLLCPFVVKLYFGLLCPCLGLA
jgi:hypothetical protein